MRFDLATKLTDGDGDSGMNEEESLAQHGFADYTFAPRQGFLDSRWLLRLHFSTATAFSSRVFNVFFGLPAMASCSIAAASRSVEVTNRPNCF